VPAPPFHPRQHPSNNELFQRILERIQRDLPEAIGLSITLHGKDQNTSVVAAEGIGIEFLESPAGESPLSDAVEYQVPVLSPDLWSDDRWPSLTADAVRLAMPEDADPDSVRGMAAVPGIWREDQTVVLCCVLSRPADASTVATLIGYEQLVSAALVTSAAEDAAGIADMLAVLQSRGAIEQAKGVIMGSLRCDAEAAWQTLRRASHESNVKLRELAVALVEHVGGVPAEQPAVAAPIVPDERARRAAGLLWAVLTHAPKPESDHR
jgi:hypothetical protein